MVVCDCCRKEIKHSRYYIQMGRELGKNVEQHSQKWVLCADCFTILDVLIKESMDSEIMRKVYKMGGGEKEKWNRNI